ncbi:hypothetical protein [Lysinibacillus sphaericus]|uniref:hypothetical protein n=1 Tax=Lysinibacillus sphaericus TaxID=1421 RepID=UPI0018CF7A6E|nr:hypothetical protein [Lysinibacillus sphaericus]
MMNFDLLPKRFTDFLYAPTNTPLNALATFNTSYLISIEILNSTLKKNPLQIEHVIDYNYSLIFTFST